MSAIEAALKAPKRRGGQRPVVDALLATMPDDLRQSAVALMESEHSDRFVAEAFTEDGYPVSPNAIRGHRYAHKVSRFAP